MPQTVTKALSLNVVPAAPVPVVIDTASLPDAVVGMPYSQQLAASGGTAPYTWALSGGTALPAGLSLSPSGLISGTPTSPTTPGVPFNFTVQVTDSGA
jgi:hypothetical protein